MTTSSPPHALWEPSPDSASFSSPVVLEDVRMEEATLILPAKPRPGEGCALHWGCCKSSERVDQE